MFKSSLLKDLSKSTSAKLSTSFKVENFFSSFIIKSKLRFFVRQNLKKMKIPLTIVEIVKEGQEIVSKLANEGKTEVGDFSAKATVENILQICSEFETKYWKHLFEVSGSHQIREKVINYFQGHINLVFKCSRS